MAFVAFHYSTFSGRQLYCRFEVLLSFLNTVFCTHRLIYFNFVSTLYCDYICECALFSFVCNLLLEVKFRFEDLKNEALYYICMVSLCRVVIHRSFYILN